MANDRRAEWEQSRAGVTPVFRGSSVPEDVRAAGSFPRGARLVDLGCGSGEIAGWLAEQGYDALGVDLAVRDRASRFDVRRPSAAAVRSHGCCA
jgi:2-polyprenyl-3-methyl-5-hydroxy-6-metoxy-1,4-benzoquinol methylase